MNANWCGSPFGYARRATREVRVGDVGIGGLNPIRVQSMTTPATTDVSATVEQIARLVAAGCEIVRVTVPTSSDARALPEIRHALAQRKIRVPLVADIHFSPGAALKAVEHVEKIRINPGNYADRKQFEVREYSDTEYDLELHRLADTFRPLVVRAGQLGVAMRIGTNHGSLSDRIMNRYGDSPLGMVESALEFVRICEVEGFRDIVVSMKSSNPVVTIEAYRLLAARMAEEGMDYPFHLGVTEAGDGEDGRIKSAVGIGSLLDDGIGDTVRVSLTEDPVEEIPVAQKLVEPYNRLLRGVPADLRDSPAPRKPGLAPPPLEAHGARRPPAAAEPVSAPFDPFSYSRRRSHEVRFGPLLIGGGRRVAVEVQLVRAPSQRDAIRAEIDAQAGPRVPLELRADLVEAFAGNDHDLLALGTLRETLRLVAPGLALSARLDSALAASLIDSLRCGRPLPDGFRPGLWDRAVVPLESLSPTGLSRGPAAAVSPWELPAMLGCAVLLEGRADAMITFLGQWPETGAAGTAAGAGGLAVGVPIPLSAPLPAESSNRSGEAAARRAADCAAGGSVHEYRRLAAGLAGLGLDLPVILSWNAKEIDCDPLLAPSLALGSLLCDGIGDSVLIRASDPGGARTLAFNILQAARVRISKTEFISCPSCGRTLFDLEETTRRIKSRTAHLKGLKIAIMGCVVNGPGEMADADFGYVGWGAGKIALFVGRELVARDIPTEVADDRLVELIKAQGKWQDPAPDAV